MQKQAPTLGRLLTMVIFGLSCFGLLLFLWLSFGGPTPLKPKGYRIEVAFPEATQLSLEADVRVSGVSIGKVRRKELGDDGNRTVATLEIDPKFAPIPADARATLRQKTLLGETYVEMTPGTRSGPSIPEGGRLRPGSIQASVELDEVIRALDPETRQSFRTWQQELAKGIRDGRGRDLNAAIWRLPQFAEAGTDLLEVLDRQEDDVRRLVRNTGTVFGALSQDRQQLRNLITGSDDVFSATQAQREDLAEAIRIFPTFLDESRATFRSLEDFAVDTRPLVRDLQPAARDLGPTLRDVRRLAPDLQRTFEDLDPLIDASVRGLPALRDVLRGAKPLLAQLQPFLEELNPVLEWLEYYQSQTSDFFTNGAAALADTTATRTDAERGHYLRQWGPLGAETFAIWPNRLSTNRGNSYLSPTAGAGPDHAKYMILPSFDCDNTGKPTPFLTSVPPKDAPPDAQTDDDPSCFEQGPLPFPPGNTRKYPHVEQADYGK